MGFQLIQILGLLGMYFDAAVVEADKCLGTFFQIVSGHTVCTVFTVFAGSFEFFGLS